MRPDAPASGAVAAAPGAAGVALACFVATLAVSSCRTSPDPLAGPMEAILASHPGLAGLAEAAPAWVVDRATGRGFFLAATLYTNADGVLNDDVYEYQTVAQPFLADLGEAAGRLAWSGDERD